MADDLDHVWRALAEPTRRALLDMLRDQPHTTGQLVERFPSLTRFAVMKHLNVLEDAGLLIVRRSGRERWNYINTVPIRQIYERWMGPYAEQWSSALLRLKDHAERDAGSGKAGATRTQGPSRVGERESANRTRPSVAKRSSEQQIEPQMRRRKGA